MVVHRSTILDASAIETVLARLAHEIHDRTLVDDDHGASKPLVLVGIRTGGAHLATRLATKLGTLCGASIPLGILDITLYRDDVLGRDSRALPRLRGTEIDFDVENQDIVLVDDVLFTGRTVRAALGALLDLGRPRRVRLCALVDRGLRELPIAADFVGRVVKTSMAQRVEVELVEEDASHDLVSLITPHERRGGGSQEGP